MSNSLTVVTGGSAGIGAKLLQILLKSGPVINISRRAAELPDSPTDHPLYQLNLSLRNTEVSCHSLDTWLAERPGLKVSRFFSCAAQLGVENLDRISEGDFADAMTLNAWAPIAITERLLKRDYLCSEGARFIFVTSSLARPEIDLSFARLGLYSSSKAALGRLVQIQQREMSIAGKKVSSTLVHPGIVDTPMQTILRSDGLCDPAFKEKTKRLPAFQAGDWEDSSPQAKPRTISAQQSAEFLAWVSRRPDHKFGDYYDYYACQDFHDEHSKSSSSNQEKQKANEACHSLKQ